MPATIPAKMVGGSHPAAVRNIYAPRADRLINLWAFTETSGTSLANLGLQQTYQNVWPTFGNGTISGTPTFETSGHSYVPATKLTETGSSKASLCTAAADFTLPRGTLLIHFREDSANNSNLPIIFFSGANVISQIGAFRVERSIVTIGDTDYDSLRVFLRYGTGANDYALLYWNETNYSPPGGGASGFPWSTWRRLVVTWGENGLHAWCDGLNNHQYHATTQGLRTYSGQRYWLNGNASFVKGNTAYSVIAMWDCVLPERDILDLLTDPHLPIRSSPSSTLHFRTHGPRAGRPTTSGAIIRMVTGAGSGGNLSSANVGHKAQYGTDAYNLSNTSDAATVSAATDINKPLTVTLNNLSAGTRYWYRGLWTPDGTNWYPSPWGLQTFCTQPSVPGSHRAVAIADTHVGRLTWTPSNGLGIEAYNAGMWNIWAVWRCLRDIWTAPDLPEFAIVLGDHQFGQWYSTDNDQSDYSAAIFGAYEQSHNACHLLHKAAVTFEVLGNHEGMAGYEQNASGTKDYVAQQKQCTIAHKRFVPNPTGTTYVEGGENEGVPTTSNSLDWVPPLAPPFDASYRTAYIIAAGDENGSPLCNYYAFTWGTALFVALDVYRYTEPGDPSLPFIGGSPHRSAPSVATLGPTQRAWLEGLLSAHPAPIKIAMAHNLLGGVAIAGNSYYFWGSGANLGSDPAAEELLVHRALKRHEGFWLQGHSHKAAIVRKGRVHYVTVPTCGAPSHLNALNADPGWHGNNWPNEFGTAQSLGADTAAGGAGAGRALGIIAMYNCPGYAVLEWTGNSLTITFRQTDYCHAQDSGALRDYPLFSERWIGDVLTASGGAVTLSETPADIGFAITEANLQQAGSQWWTQDLSGYDARLLPCPYPYATDEDQISATVALASETQGDVRVLSVPRNLYTRSFTITGGRNMELYHGHSALGGGESFTHSVFFS